MDTNVINILDSVNHPLCYVCGGGRRVSVVRSYRDEPKQRMVYEFRCHGDVDRFYLNDEEFEAHEGEWNPGGYVAFSPNIDAALSAVTKFYDGDIEFFAQPGVSDPLFGVRMLTGAIDKPMVRDERKHVIGSIDNVKQIGNEVHASITFNDDAPYEFRNARAIGRIL